MVGRRHRGYPITAYGLCNGLGQSVAEVLEGLAAGRPGLRAPPLDLPFTSPCGVVKDAPALPAEYHAFDSRLMRIALLALDPLRPQLERAVARWGTGRVAIVLGTSTGGLAATERAFAERMKSGHLPVDYDFASQHPFHALLDFVIRITGLRGPAYVISTACSASSKAIASALRLLNAGSCDAVLVGGADTLCHTTLRGFHALGVLSPDACRPFGEHRTGINLGEGAAFALLERRGEASTHVLAVGESSDAHHMSAPDPGGRGARAAMERALAKAGLTSAEVDHVNAHGTGTLANDAVEARAIADVIGRAPVVSTKGLTGHLLGSGGITEAILSTLSLEHQFLPASAGSSPVDSTLPLQVNLRTRKAALRHVLSNSFAFGGSNASILLGYA